MVPFVLVPFGQRVLARYRRPGQQTTDRQIESRNDEVASRQIGQAARRHRIRERTDAKARCEVDDCRPERDHAEVDDQIDPLVHLDADRLSFTELVDTRFGQRARDGRLV